MNASIKPGLASSLLDLSGILSLGKDLSHSVQHDMKGLTLHGNVVLDC